MAVTNTQLGDAAGKRLLNSWNVLTFKGKTFIQTMVDPAALMREWLFLGLPQAKIEEVE